MKILLDENIPIKLKYSLSNFEVFTVRDMNWDGYKNGELLRTAIENGFTVFITSDKNLQYQQNISAIKISVIVLDILFFKWSSIEPLVPEIINILPLIEIGNTYLLSDENSRI